MCDFLGEDLSFSTEDYAKSVSNASNYSYAEID